MENVIEKIRKLLALAGGENDHEAQAAMLKARELMARNKLTEQEITAADKPGTLNKEPYAEQGYSSNLRYWFIDLSRTIAENHCCAVGGIKVNSLFYTSFIGLDDDPKIACEVFGYAVQYIQGKVKGYREFLKGHIFNVKERNRAVLEWENSYARAFSRGLADQYAEQFRQAGEESLALALVKPAEVVRYADSMKTRRINVRHTDHNAAAAMQGYKDGKNFHPVKQLRDE